MTFIKPDSPFSRLTYVLGGLVVLVAIVASWLIAMYVNVVDLEHGISSTKEHIQTLEANSAIVRDNTYSLLDANSFDALAETNNLVKDRDPRYVTIDQEWSLVSRY